MNAPEPRQRSSIGRRVQVIGNSCSGKSTLARRLAGCLNAPFIELDALNWQPNWVGLNTSDPIEFERRIASATVGDAWVVAGSYEDSCRPTLWPRLQTLIWLDLTRPLLIRRTLRRSWRADGARESCYGEPIASSSGRS